MIETFETPSGIALPCETRSERQIELALKQLDRDLFLTKEVHRPTGARCYAVYQYLSPTRPPLHILFWTHDRKSSGKPLPLSSGLVYEVESRKRFAGRNLAAEATAQNEQQLEADLAEADEERDEARGYFRRRLRMGSAANSRRFFNLDKVGRE